MPAVEGDGFDFIYENLPTDVNFQTPNTIGQLSATETQYNVTCPSPVKRKMYLEGEGAKFNMAILVDSTTEYTVEFWFHFNNATDVHEKIHSQDVTYLYMMEGAKIDENNTTLISANTMEIYVENN